MMKIIEIAVEILSPVVVSPPTYVSGSALRGALAAKYIREKQMSNPAQERVFQDLFIKEKVYFSDLIPGGEVLPLTALACKRQPGFEQEGKHGIYDTLLANIASKKLLSCPDCSQDLKRIEGFHDFSRLHKLETSISTHVGIERATSTAAQEILYSDAEIEEGQMIFGRICSAEDCIPALIDILEGHFYIGRSKTRGKGKARVASVNEITMDIVVLCSEWELWNQKAKELLGDSWRWDFLFALTLKSDTIIVDELLRPSNDPSNDVIWLPKVDGGVCTFGNGTIESVFHFSQLDRISGWNSAHGLPKNDDFGIRRGSVFVYGFLGNEKDRHQLQERLVELAVEGIGLRKTEGFGQITVNDFFHSKQVEVVFDD